jgi:hypothetical protein
MSLFFFFCNATTVPLYAVLRYGSRIRSMRTLKKYIVGSAEKLKVKKKERTYISYPHCSDTPPIDRPLGSCLEASGLCPYILHTAQKAGALGTAICATLDFGCRRAVLPALSMYSRL